MPKFRELTLPMAENLDNWLKLVSKHLSNSEDRETLVFLFNKLKGYAPIDDNWKNIKDSPQLYLLYMAIVGNSIGTNVSKWNHEWLKSICKSLTSFQKKCHPDKNLDDLSRTLANYWTLECNQLIELLRKCQVAINPEKRSSIHLPDDICDDEPETFVSTKTEVKLSIKDYLLDELDTMILEKTVMFPGGKEYKTDTLRQYYLRIKRYCDKYGVERVLTVAFLAEQTKMNQSRWVRGPIAFFHRWVKTYHPECLYT